LPRTPCAEIRARERPDVGHQGDKAAGRLHPPGPGQRLTGDPAAWVMALEGVPGLSVAGDTAGWSLTLSAGFVDRLLPCLVAPDEGVGLAPRRVRTVSHGR